MRSSRSCSMRRRRGWLAGRLGRVEWPHDYLATARVDYRDRARGRGCIRGQRAHQDAVGGRARAHRPALAASTAMKVYVLMIGYEAEEVRVFTTRELAEQAQSAVGHPIVGIEECELERP